MKNILLKASTIIFYCYFLSTIIFMPYYNWQYANENGFIKWLAFGEVIATGKGIIWPYFIFVKKHNNENVEHFQKSIEYSNEATKLGNKSQSNSYLYSSDIKNIINLKKQAMDEGKLVDIEKLNLDHPNWGNYFRDEYIKGLLFQIDGYEQNQVEIFVQGKLLLDSWGKWYTENIANIEAGNKIEVQTKHIDINQNLETPSFNNSELIRVSNILKKVMIVEVLDYDLKELHNVMRDYTDRTKRKLTKSEYNSFIYDLRLSNDYIHELGQSLLNSWDKKNILTTSKYDELYKLILNRKLRAEGKMNADVEELKAAANNQNFIEDEFGKKYHFDRKAILQYIKHGELCNSNLKRIVIVIEDFVE